MNNDNNMHHKHTIGLCEEQIQMQVIQLFTDNCSLKKNFKAIV